MAPPPSFDQRWCEPAPPDLKLVPFITVTKFCYKFAPEHLKQPIASAFFDNNQIFDRQWDVYFIYSDYTRFIAFVPDHQLQALLGVINSRFPDANLNTRGGSRNFAISFEGIDSELCPRWLGRSTSRHHYANMVDDTCKNFVRVNTSAQGDDSTVQLWRDKMDQAMGLTRSSKSRGIGTGQSSDSAALRRSLVAETEAAQLLYAQQLLGLHAVEDPGEQLPNIEQLSMKPTNVSQEQSSRTAKDVVLIAIDIEAIEQPPFPISEIGVATLDIRDIQALAPGRAGRDWHRFIRARHFRIAEHKDHVNHKYVKGCPDKFEFGTSQIVRKADIVDVLMSCFREPFSGKSAQASPTGKHQTAPSSPSKDRQVVLVGHSVLSDVSFCQQMGIDIFKCGNVLGSIDTASLDRALRQTEQTTSLGKVLYHHDLDGWYLHNAGNDAVYTLQAMLATCVAAAKQIALSSNQSAAGPCSKDKRLTKRTGMCLTKQCINNTPGHCESV